MKKNRTLIVMSIALLTAGIAAYGVYRAIQQLPVREVEVASVEVVVASQTLPVGTRLTTDHLRDLAPIPPSTNPTDRLRNTHAKTRRRLASDIASVALIVIRDGLNRMSWLPCPKCTHSWPATANPVRLGQTPDARRFESV